MKTPAQSIEIGITEFLPIYQKAIQEFWEFSKLIAGAPVENWFIAQAVQESRFDANAVSPAGAKGIAQFMPATAKEIAKELSGHELFKNGFDVTNKTQSAFAQVYFMNKLFKAWKWNRTDASRMQLALASYNAGLGSILNAQRASNNKKHWLEIKGHLKRITGLHSKETIIYVSNITSFALIVEDYKAPLEA